MDNSKLAKICLRLGLAIVFGYAGIGSLLQPDIWIGYLPVFISKLSFASQFLTAFSILELLLVVWLLSGWRTKFAAIFATLILLGIVGANITDFSIVFRDLGLIFTAVALSLLS